MSDLHPLANKGSFLPPQRETIFIDANLELSHLIDHLFEKVFPDQSLTDAHEFLMRGILMRIQALGGVMFSSACATDEELKSQMTSAYGKHHNFNGTTVDEVDVQGGKA